MKTKIKTLSKLSILFLIILTIPLFIAYAAGGEDLVPCTLKECTFCHLLLMVNNIIQWLLGIAFVVGVLFIILNGFLYILSIGDEGMMGSAKQGLWLSVIGFAICLLAWLFIHVTYLIIGYKGDTWYEIECNVENSSNLNFDNDNLVYFPKEVNPESLRRKSQSYFIKGKCF